MRSLFLLLVFLTTALTSQSQSKNIIILHTNDMHSRLNGFGPEANYTPLELNDDKTLGGFTRLQSAIASEKAEYGDDCFVVDAGDFLMGTLFQTIEMTTGFELNLMEQMGYDVIALGNHEFDWGPQSLATIIISAKNHGAIPPIVCTNLKTDSKNPDDDRLEALIQEGTISPYQILERNGLRVGFIGILGYDAIDVAPMARPITFEDPIKTAKLWAKKLKEEMKVDIVVCLSHSGVEKEKDGEWGGEDEELAEKVPEIDIIISGHTHTHLFKPMMVGNTPVVQAGANTVFLGRLEMNYNEGQLSLVKGELITMDDNIMGEPHLQNQIDDQVAKIDQEVLQPLGLEYRGVVTETSFPLKLGAPKEMTNSNLGKLLADATFSYVNNIPGHRTDISLFASGMIRDDIGVGVQSTSDVFCIAGLGMGEDNVPGYALATAYVTAKELKGIMEVLCIAPSMGPDYVLYFGGAKITYNPKKGMLRKIVSIEMLDESGELGPIDLSKKNEKLYAVTTNTYILEFVGIIKKFSKGLVKVTLKDAEGNPIKDISSMRIDIDPDIDGIQEAKEWLAIQWYLSHFTDSNGNGVPDIPERYQEGTPHMWPTVPKK